MKRLKKVLAMLLACCMVLTCMPITVEALTEAEVVKDGKIKAENFYAADGSNVNDKYNIKGILVEEDGNSYAVMSINGANHKDIEKIRINGSEWISMTNEIFAMRSDLTVTFPDGTSEIFVSHGQDKDAGWCLIPLGNFNDIVLDENNNFTIGIDTPTGGDGSGWDVQTPDMEVTVNLGYKIEKSVDEENAYLGDTLHYTVTISNTGDYTVSHINVTDILPVGLEKTSVNVEVENHPEYTWKWATDMPDERIMVLDTGISLKKDESKTYKISATVLDDFKGGEIENWAVMNSTVLKEQMDNAITTVHAYFYVHHIRNDGTEGNESGVEERVDKVEFNDTLRSGTKFNVTAVGGGVGAKSYTKSKTEDTDWSGTAVDYAGLLNNTLYGGIFEADRITLHDQFRAPAEGETNPDYKNEENGIGFTPKVNEHYYVWEPTDKYLRPINLAVWHTHGAWNPVEEGVTQYHTVAGYPLAVVDRKYYQEFGFVENNEITPEKIYNSVTATQNFDKLDTNTLNAQHLGLTGYLGTYKTPGTFFNNNVANGETFLPYWVTHDGVKVTGIYQRNAKYSGLGSELSNKMFNVEDTGNTYSVETYTAPTQKPLMAKAMFYDNNLTHPLIPEIVGVNFESITAGKSGNIKSVKLTLDLSEFKYDRAWFDVNGEIVEAKEMDGMLSAMISKKDTELTIIPHWSYGDKEFTGAAKLLSVTKRSVEDITPLAQDASGCMPAASFRTSKSLDESSSGVILQ